MTITKRYTSKLSISDLYEAWISPEMTISPVIKIDIDPRIGGQFILHSQMQNTTSIMKGRILEIIKDQKLIYTWHWEGSDETSVVTVDFASESDQSIIQISHIGLLTKESEKNHSMGWDAYFEALEKKLIEQQ